ncbi:MAG: DUF4416 family protein, partial [Spirochaetia bacterium]|nr:DUF4416 family protein [Spirochaetia bacterium]
MESMKWKPNIVEPPPCRVFIAAYFDDLQRYVDVKKEIEKGFGEVDFTSESLDSDSLPSVYKGVSRRHVRFLSLKRPSGREEIVDLKKTAIGIETKFQSEGRPSVELDIGYVTDSSVVRSSLEDGYGRIYIYGGIYAETLYYFENYTFHALQGLPLFYFKKEVVTVFNDLR